MDGFAPTLEPPLPRDIGPEHTRKHAGSVKAATPRPEWLNRWGAWGPFLLVVVAPMLVLAGYYYLIAADQFVSEAHFVVRTSAPSTGAVSGLGQALGLGGASADQAGARSVDDYLTSHDAVAALGQTIDLVAVFRRPEADLISRLHGGTRPPPETLLKFYRGKVKVAFSGDTGITTLTVRAFRSDDARRIAERLLELGEARVNTFNQRALENSLSVARTQLREAEMSVAQAQGSVTGFRQDERDIDPERSSTAQISLLTSLQQQLAQERAQLTSMTTAVDASSPQRVALATHVRALEAQVAGVQAHLAGPTGAMAPGLGAFESLRLRQEFAAKRYEAAAAALETARTEALKQELFVIRVVEPNLPVKSTYPQRFKIVSIVFLGLLLTYAIGWLILAGVREHAA
jgi:capsular polysaccharide transport system permease protein